METATSAYKSTLVVLAHPEQRSFNGSWAKASVKACEALGDSVQISDLVADGFNPVESALHYSTFRDLPAGEVFDPLKAQEQAAATNGIPADVAIEMEKIQLADRVIIHFPLWWFGPPAILKGWLDRCLVHGALHNVEERFDKGRCRGKKVLFCVSTGATADECSFAGKEGDINLLLWPLAYTFRYLGFTVLEPQLAHGVHGYFEGASESALERRLNSLLADHSAVMGKFDALPTISFNSDSDFNSNGVLKPGAPEHTPFIRHDR